MKFVFRHNKWNEFGTKLLKEPWCCETALAYGMYGDTWCFGKTKAQAKHKLINKMQRSLKERINKEKKRIIEANQEIQRANRYYKSVITYVQKVKP